MIYPTYFDSKKSFKLFGLSNIFTLLKKLYIKNKLPKVLMLSGKKGSGKSTLVNHFLFSIFDKKNYSNDLRKLSDNSTFINLFLNNIHPNIIYLFGSDFKNTKIEDVRNLKKKISQTSISDKPRFIIFDDVELFNNNSLNALLKTIEEPSENNFFVLINNQSKPLLDTIKSRSLEIKIILSEKERLDITEFLIDKFKINSLIDPIKSQLTPGSFIKFNYIFDEYKISINEEYLENLSILLNLFKKDKEVLFIDMILFLTDSYFNNLKNAKSLTNNNIIECKRFIFKNINNFFLYNLNQNALLNNINSKINNG
jgi:GTPase SAR1 family protein